MKRLIALSLFAGALFGQNTLTSTTLGQTITPTQQTFTLASVSAISFNPSTMIYVDREAMLVINMSGAYITVSRGQLNTAALTHTLGATVLVGRPNWFYTFNPSGTCSVAPVTPYVNVNTGQQWTCSGGQWTLTGGGGSGVISISTTAPITGGPITTTGTIGCPTCGDASTNTSSSVDNEMPLFSGTSGKLLKRATGTGFSYLTSGVVSTVDSPIVWADTLPTPAACDGVTDDSAAFNSAVAGTTVGIPGGATCIVTNLQPANNVTYACSAGATFKKLAGSTTTYLLTTSASNFSMTGCTINPNAVTQTTSSLYSIFLSSATNVRIKDIRFAGTGSPSATMGGILAYHTSGIIDAPKFDSTVGGTHIKVDQNSQKFLKIQNIQSDGSQENGVQVTVSSSYTAELVPVNVEIAGGRISNVTDRTGVSTGPLGNAVSVFHADGGVLVHDLTSDTTRFSGVRVTTSNNVKVYNNVIKAAGETAIYCGELGGIRNECSGNTIINSVSGINMTNVSQRAGTGGSDDANIARDTTCINMGDYCVHTEHDIVGGVTKCDGVPACVTVGYGNTSHDNVVGTVISTRSNTAYPKPIGAILVDKSINTGTDLISFNIVNTGSTVSANLVPVSLPDGATISGITKANPAVVSYSNTPTVTPAIGQTWCFKAIGGMVEMNGQCAAITAVSAGVSMTFGSINSTGYTTFANPTGGPSSGAFLLYSTGTTLQYSLPTSLASGTSTYPSFGWTQSMISSTATANAYTYKATAPVYTASSYNVFSPMWFDSAGFPSSYLIGGATNSVPQANTIFQVTSNAISKGKHTAFAGYLTTGDGNLSTQAGYFQNGKGTTDDIIMYALNTHVAGCPAFKCDGTVVPDYDNGTLISIEADTEVRGTNQQGIGVYSACVNCVAGGLPTSAFLSYASPSLIHGDAAAIGWTAAYNTTSGSATIGLNLNPLLNPDRTATPKSNSMSQRQCAYTSNTGPTYDLECWTQTYTQNSVLNRTTPGSKVYELGSSGTSLSALIAVHLHTPQTADVTLGHTDMGQIYSNLGATGTVNITLPASPINGEWVEFEVEASQTLNILGGGHNFRDGPLTGTPISSGTIGSVIRIMAVSTTVWQVQYRNGNWALNSNQLGTNSNGIIVVGTDAGQTVGQLRIQGNDGGGGTNEFTIKSGIVGTNTVSLKPPPSTANVTLNAVAQATPVPGVATINTMAVSTTSDGGGDKPMAIMRGSIPLPNRVTSATTASITNNNPNLIGCIAVDAAHFTVSGRGFEFKAYGYWTTIVTDTPAFNFRITMYTNGTCSTGATDISTSSTYSATVNALTNAAWSVDVESAYILGSTAWATGGNTIATFNAAANPLIRQFNINGPTVFDPTTCTSSTCGVGLRVTATGGTIAGTPTVTLPVMGAMLEYK